jgi:hypothetical protein
LKSLQLTPLRKNKKIIKRKLLRETTDLNSTYNQILKTLPKMVAQYKMILEGKITAYL